MLQKAYMFYKDGELVALDEDGIFQPVESHFSPEYENVSTCVQWRLRDGSTPELGDGKLLANAIIVGDKVRLQICLTSGKTTVIPENDGFLFVLSGVIAPSVWALQYGLGGIGNMAMESRDDGVMAGKYLGHAELVSKTIDGKEQPCIAVYYLDGAPLSHLTPVSAIHPFNWRDAEEGQNKMKIQIEYEY